jgi:hypothetical protein
MRRPESLGVIDEGGNCHGGGVKLLQLHVRVDCCHARQVATPTPATIATAAAAMVSFILLA